MIGSFLLSILGALGYLLIALFLAAIVLGILFLIGFILVKVFGLDI